MKTKVLLREEDKLVEVNITGKRKPKIEDFIKQRWQKVISLLADILDVPSGLIMKITKNHMKVFLKSENIENPYPTNGKDKLQHGLYCETVIGKDKELHVENSLNSQAWKDNPDVKLNMISYYGLPIKWSDGNVFGTICVLDNKGNRFEKKYRDLLYTFKEMIEQDLMLLEEKQILELQSDIDFLTNIANRRAFNDVAHQYFVKYKKTGEKFALIMMDIDHFKYINDRYGHVTGDKILKRFAEVSRDTISKTSLLARYGGDEFILVTKKCDEVQLKKIIEDIRNAIHQDNFLCDYKIDFSYGMAVVDEEIEDVESFIELADKNLYKYKSIKTINIK